jgi:phage shock protein C
MSKKLALSSNKKIAGVCGGLAEYLEIDATLVRVAWLLLVLCAGVGLLAYIICWILFPKA